MAIQEKGVADTTETLAAMHSAGGFGRICAVMERNIQTLHLLQQRTAVQRSFQERMADIITDWSGRMAFVYLHAGWFALWVLLNTGKFGIHPFDPFPYGLLTMIVSLEAIFLSTFVLISQNRISSQSESQNQLLLHIALLTEHEVTRSIKMLDAIQDKIGIENDSDLELMELEQETRPEDVLEELARIKQSRGEGI